MLTADQLVDAYVADVARLLPRKQRADVAMELRALLHDEIDAAAVDPARPDQAARDYLTGLGRPAEVAARYGPPVNLIDPSDTRWFLTLAGAGSVLLVLGGLLNILGGQTNGGDFAARVRTSAPGLWPWILSWLGVLGVGFALAAWSRRRWPSLAAWKPKPVPGDRISRTGRIALIAAGLAGATVLIKPDWFFHFPATRQVFAYDEDFLRLRGPVLATVMTVTLIIQVIVVVHGEWRSWTRDADLIGSLVTCAVLAWALSAPIFRSEPTDQAMRGSISLVILVSLIGVGQQLRRRRV